MNLISEVFNGVLVVHAPEYLGDDQSKGLHQYVLHRPQRNVVVDMDATDIVDSKGLSMLLDIHDWLVENDGDLKVSTANSTNRKIFEITRIDKHIDVFRTVLTAVKSFQ